MKSALCLLLAFCPALLLSSCSMGPSGAAYSNQWESTGRASGGYSTPPNAADSASQGSYSPAPAPPSTTRRSEVARYAQPKARPGLGTEWGQERESYVSSTRFARDSSRPVGVGSIFYNDRSGAIAMTRDAGRYDVTSVKSVAGGIASLSVTDSRGRVLPAYFSKDRIVCIGETGERYQLLARNHSDRRLELVMTVDGLDVLDGQSGSYSKRGYILEPGESYRVEGWRMSDSKVASFRFASVADSYANQKHGDTRNVGVIGLAVFPEEGRKPRVLSIDPVRHTAADPFPGRYASPP